MGLACRCYSDDSDPCSPCPRRPTVQKERGDGGLARDVTGLGVGVGGEPGRDVPQMPLSAWVLTSALLPLYSLKANQPYKHGCH